MTTLTSTEPTPSITRPRLGFFKQLRNCAAIATLALTPYVSMASDATFLVQLKDYEGKEAYFSLYLVNPDGRYVRTLWVSGDDDQWYKDLPRWWKYTGRAPQDLAAITGASTKPGDRSVIHIELEEELLNQGFKVRVESSIEDKENHPVDVETLLTSDLHGQKIPGTGHVRYIRYKW